MEVLMFSRTQLLFSLFISLTGCSQSQYFDVIVEVEAGAVRDVDWIPVFRVQTSMSDTGWETFAPLEPLEPTTLVVAFGGFGGGFNDPDLRSPSAFQAWLAPADADWKLLDPDWPHSEELIEFGSNSFTKPTEIVLVIEPAE
jgi:hypothetical protein